MLKKVRQSRRLLFLIGFVGWLILWTVYYVIAEATNPLPNLAAAVMCIMSPVVISFVAIVLLLLVKLWWTALGYVAAMTLNGVGLVMVDGVNILYYVSSFPFFLPNSFRP